jgi:hypothetical protein
MKEDKMSENKSRREFISQSGKMVTACALFGATGSVAYAADSAKPTCETGKPMSITAKHYYLDNVLLEAGFNFDGSVATSTRTELKTLEIKDGKIVALRDNKQPRRRHAAALRCGRQADAPGDARHAHPPG